MDKRNRELRQERMAEAGIKAQQYGTVATLLKNLPNPNDHEGLLQELADFGLSDMTTLRQIARSVAPTIETQREVSTARGVNALSPEELERIDTQAAAGNLTGMNTGDIAAAEIKAEVLGGEIDPAWKESMALNYFTGLTPGRYAADRADANLSPERQNTGALIRGGQQMSATDQGNYNLGVERNRLTGLGIDDSLFLGHETLLQGDRRLISDMALRNLQWLDGQGAATAAMMKASDTESIALIESTRKILSDIHSGTMSDPALLEAYRMINHNYSILRRNGYTDFQPIHIGEAVSNTRKPSIGQRTFGRATRHDAGSWRP